MTPLQLALKYMDIVFSNGDMMQLKGILAQDLVFNGPFHQSNTAKDYIDSMVEAPPEDFEYKLIQSFETASSACLIYEFIKPGVSTTMAQVFEIKNDKIIEIQLIFDTAAFQ
ncbi:hypothetical protein [Splendidivirga corallicola]